MRVCVLVADSAQRNYVMTLVGNPHTVIDLASGIYEEAVAAFLVLINELGLEILLKEVR